MLFCMLNVLIFALSGLSAAAETIVPFTTCSRGSVDYFACLKHSLEEVWPRLVEKGLPEFDFLPLDPFILYENSEVAINSGDIHAKVILSNVTARGLTNMHFYDVRMHVFDNTFHLEVDALAPRLFIKGTVKMDGTLGIFRIADEGPFNITADEVSGTWDITGHIENDTIIVEHYHLLPEVKKLKLYFEFFQDNKELNNLVVTFINEFWPPLYRAVLPIADEAWDPLISAVCNRLLSKIPFSKLFP